jgi:glycosyltransferase involved in cell wall biosynthesis
MPRPGLSVCMIVRDEARTLNRCIASLEDLPDEICILDTGSTDDTVSLARALGAHVVVDTSFNDEHGLICDFGAARNTSLKMARNSWILHIDADEVLIDGSHSHIRTQMAEDDVLSVAVAVISGVYEFPAIRLFRKHPFHQFDGIVHECIAHPVGVATNRSIKIINYPDKLGKETSIERDLRLCSLGMERFPRDSRYVEYLARALKRAGRYSEAVAVYDKCLAFGNHSSIMLHSLYSDLAICFLLMSKWPLAAHFGNIALEHFPGLPETHCIVGDALLAMGDLEEAKERYLRALAFGRQPRSEYSLFVDQSFYEDYPSDQIALIENIKPAGALISAA